MSTQLNLAFVAALLLGYVTAQTEEQRSKYQSWTDVCDKNGYEWEPYTVETADGWFLTLFHITKVKGEALQAGSDKPPIYFQHGAG